MYIFMYIHVTDDSIFLGLIWLIEYKYIQIEEFKAIYNKRKLFTNFDESLHMVTMCKSFFDNNV